MNFREGQYIILTRNNHMAAKVGAVALVTESYDDEYVGVKWICELAGFQMDGKYNPKDFRLCAPLDEELR